MRVRRFKYKKKTNIKKNTIADILDIILHEQICRKKKINQGQTSKLDWDANSPLQASRVKSAHETK